MKYVKNGTDNTIVFKTISNGVQKEITFLKLSVTAVSEATDTLFSANAKYVKMFTDGLVSYSTKPSETHIDDCTDYYISSYYDSENETVHIKVADALLGETIGVYYSVDGTAVQNVVFEDTETTDLEINTAVTESFEFRLGNDVLGATLDFPISYSKRIKFYV